jgi:hypothetical protein
LMGKPQLLNHYYHAVKNLFDDMHALTRHPNCLWPHLVAKSLGHFLLLPLQRASCYFCPPESCTPCSPTVCVESIRQGSYELVSFCDFSSGFNFSVWNEIVSSIGKCFFWW